MNQISGLELKKIIRTATLSVWTHTLSVSVSHPTPDHLSPMSPLCPIPPTSSQKIDMYSAWWVINISICEEHFSSPYTLGWRTHTHTPTRVCAFLTELFHFRLSNNPATASLHVLDMHAQSESEREEDASRRQSATLNMLNTVNVLKWVFLLH